MTPVRLGLAWLAAFCACASATVHGAETAAASKVFSSPAVAARGGYEGTTVLWGGRIFERVPGLRKLAPDVRARVIDNAHSLRFAPWAEMWGLDYSWASQVLAPFPSHPDVREVIEIVPDAEASRRVWARYDALWS